MKRFLSYRKAIFLISGGALILLYLWFYFSSSYFRNIASFTNAEMEYAEDMLLGTEPADDSLDVHPQWSDSLKKEPTIANTIQQQVETELQKEYEDKLLKAFREKTGKEIKKTNLEINLKNQANQFYKVADEVMKKEHAEYMVKEARKDGYELILDENYKVISVQKIKTP